MQFLVEEALLAGMDRSEADDFPADFVQQSVKNAEALVHAKLKAGRR